MLKDHPFVFPRSINDLLIFLSENNMELTLVGGSVRDHLLGKALSKDLDIEYRSKCSTDDLVENLKLNFKDVLSIERLNFDVLRIIFDGYELELSRARTEIYKQIPNSILGHSDFEVRFDQNLSYKDSFKRRDLTINAIGAKFLVNEGFHELVYPYNGVQDLKDKVLNSVSNSFFKDPVRFLRLIRFHIQTGFKISSTLEASLGHFNLEKLTHYYFFKEAFKCDILKFITIFFDLIKKYNISKSVKFDILIKLCGKINQTEIKTSYDLYYYAINKCNFNIDDCNKLSEILPIKKKIIKTILSSTS